MRLRFGLFFFLPLAGCSGYLAGDFDEFKIHVAENYPVGSSVDKLERDLRKRGFRETGPVFISTGAALEPLPVCFQRNLSYGFWAGGQRSVCVRLNDDRTTAEIESYQLVAGL